MAENTFIPQQTKTNHCKDQQPTGIPSMRYDYPTKALTGDINYPTEWGVCDPYLHYNMLLQGLIVITDFQSVGPAIFDSTIVSKGTVTAPTFYGNLVGNVTGVASGNKSTGAFDIPHWKKENTRIRHIIAEGPEPGIYVRGRLTGKNVIELPEYWDGLVDPETLTVTLTQIGYSQDLIVDGIEWGKRVKIKSGNGTTIDCFYEVWVARWLDPRDHSKKLHVTYEGKSPADYPGDNKDFLVGGWDYDRRETQWHNNSSLQSDVNLDT